MNKKVIAIAVSAALLPMSVLADVDVYGRVHVSVDSLDNGDTGSTYFSSNSSRLGVKGSTDFENGLTGIFQLEGGVSMNDTGGWGTTRDSFVGVKGDFGTVIGGRLPAANQYIYDANLFGDQVGDAGNFTGEAMPGRINNALHYVSPNFSGLTVALTHVLEQGVDNGSANGIRVAYKANKINAALTHFTLGDALAASFTESVTALSAGYDFGMGHVKMMGVQTSAQGGVTGADRTIITVGAGINAGPGTAKAQVSIADESASGAKNGATMTAVGYDYPLYKNATIYATYATVSNDDNATYHPFGWGHGARPTPAVSAAGKSPSGISFGLVYNF